MQNHCTLHNALELFSPRPNQKKSVWTENGWRLWGTKETLWTHMSRTNACIHFQRNYDSFFARWTEVWALSSERATGSYCLIVATNCCVVRLTISNNGFYYLQIILSWSVCVGATCFFRWTTLHIEQAKITIVADQKQTLFHCSPKNNGLWSCGESRVFVSTKSVWCWRDAAAYIVFTKGLC